MNLFDVGVNLLDERLEPDQVIADAYDAGVARICVISTQPSDWPKALALCEKYPQHLVFTVGVHPHYAKLVHESDYEKLIDYAQHPLSVAIGECGLDFNRNFSSPECQREVFLKQLDIAKHLKMPVYLHERDAFDEQMTCLKKVFRDDIIRGVAHCFTGDEHQLKHYVAMGLHIGVTGWLCDEKRNQSLVNAVSHLPLNRLLIDTDAPYLFPKTVRPRQRNNTPAMLPHILDFLVELSGHELDSLASQSYENALNLFGLDHG